MMVTLVPIVLAVAVLAPQATTQPVEPDEQPIALKLIINESPRHMSVSEDRRMLVLSVRDRVVIWDIVKGAKIGEVTVAGLAGAFIRGDKLIAGGGYTGIVSIFDAKTLAPLCNIETPTRSIYNLSAASGKAFDGKVFISSRDGLYVVDTDKKTATKLCDPPRRRSTGAKARVYAGPGGKTLQYGYIVYRLVEKQGQRSLLRLGDVTALGSDPYFNSLISLGRQGVYEIGNSVPIMQREGAIFIPDCALPVFYCLDPNRLECRLLDVKISLVGTKPMAQISSKDRPKKPSARKSWPSMSSPGAVHSRMLYSSGCPVAVTIGKDLFIFASGTGGVWSARTGAFDLSAAKSSAQSTVAELRTVHVEGPVRQMDMSEDGKSLFLSLTELDRVSVLDVVTGKPVASLPCKAPTALLCRGRSLFVGGQDGTVAVFSLDDWTMRKELSAGRNPVASLSAPGGKYFKGKLLASDGKNNYLVNIAANQAALLKEVGPCKWSYAGNIIYAWPGFGGPEKPAKEVLAKRGGSPQPPPQGYLSWPVGRQYHEESQWQSLWRPSEEEKKQFMTTVSDVTSPVQHALYENKLMTLRLKDNAVLSTRPVIRNLPIPWPKRGSSRNIKIAVAATIEGVTYLYAVNNLDYRLHRMVMPLASADQVSGPFPTGIEIGKSLRHKLPGAPAGPAEYVVVKGPAGITISADGTLDWTPAPTDAGEHNLKIRVKKDDELSFIRLPLAVCPAGDSGLLSDMLELSWSSQSAGVTWSLDRRSMLVASKMKLLVIGPDGRGVIKRLHPKRNYTKVWQRPGGYLATHEQSLYVLDKTFKEVREIDVKERILQVAPSPRQAVSYVLTNSSAKNAANRKMLYALNERLGTLRPLPKAFANGIAMDPRGQFLFAIFNNRGGVKGYFVTVWGGVWEVREANYVLVAYAANGTSLRPAKAVQLRDYPHEIAVSSNGERVAVRFTNHWVTYDRRLKLTGKDIQAKITEMHPYLPLGLMKTDQGLRMVNMEGQDVTDKLDTRRLDGQSVNWAKFCPDGRHVLVCTGRSSRMGSILRSLPLKLSTVELAAVSKAAPVPVTAAPPPGTIKLPPRPGDPTAKPAFQNKTVARKELESLALPRPTKDLTPKDIGRRYMDSVVVIRAGNGSGTGFVVGGGGYILTCDHVLGGRNRVMISYRSGGNMSATTGQVIARDKANDLALLKIPPMRGKLPAVPLAKGKPQAGEKVTVIGHPALGSRTLDYTLTSGIVSQIDHKIGGLSYVQTTATVNPGNSGGPIFDEKGCLLGAVVLKDLSAEKRSFVIGPERVKAFLERCTTGVKK